MRQFRDALNARVCMFCNPAVEAKFGLAWAPDAKVRFAPGALGEQAGIVGRRERLAAEAMMAGTALFSVHSLFRSHAVWAARWARAQGARYWIVPHDILDPYVFETKTLAKLLWMRLHGRRVIAGSSAVICSTTREAEKANRWLSDARVEVIYWPTDLPDPLYVAQRRQETRLRFGVTDRDRVLLFSGRLHPMKRPERVFLAGDACRASNVHFWYAGPEDGIAAREIMAAADAAGAKHVRCFGLVSKDQLGDLLAASDVSVSLSIRENFGHSTAEALAHGRPVVLSPGNDLARDLKGVGCGWVLDDDRIETLGAVLRDISSSSCENLFERGRLGRSWAARELTFDRFRARLRALGSEIVGRQLFD
ncbi:MAG TPA: glycosyltransferase [Rhizobium sp.]|nr:glycosyltransferase [Rhizobium sp.]